MKIKWYTHNCYENIGSIREAVDNFELSPQAKERLANDLRNAFYEVKFDVEVNETTGHITKIIPEKM